jgi:hypothetical protein
MLILDAHVIVAVQLLRIDFPDGLNKLGASVHLNLRKRSSFSNNVLFQNTARKLKSR